MLGDNPRALAAFNVIDLSEDPPVVKVWIVGSRAGGRLEQLAKDRRTKPLSREELYFAVSQSKSGSGKKQTVQVNIEPVKDRDLPDDWETDPLSAEELDSLSGQCYDHTFIHSPSRSQLDDIVDTVADG